MSVLRSWLIVALFALLGVAAGTRDALAQVAVTAATGGGAISADTAGVSWTALTGPVLAESGTASIGTGTIVLNAPAGFQFNTAAPVMVSVARVGGSNNSSFWIDLGNGPGNPANATITATTITITVFQASRSNSQNSLTWSGIQVQPTAHCPLASGTISRTGTASMTLSSANLGSLAETVGATRMLTVLSGQSFASCSGVSGSPTTQAAGVAFNLTSLVVDDQWGNVDTSYAGSKTIAYSGPSGTNTYTTTVSFSNGASTTALATTINSAQTTTLTATDGAVPGTASSSFTVTGGYTYYSISYPGGSTAVTCDVAQVTITAYNPSNVATAPPAGTTLNISTSTGAGVWTGLVGGVGILSGYGANNGAATYVWAGGESSITLNLRQNTPATINVNLLDSNGKLENSGTSDPSITFVNAAFRVTDAAGTAVAGLGTQISGKPSNTGFGAQARYLQAIRTDTSTGACTTVFPGQTVSVGLAAARLNPTGGASALSVQNSGGAMQAVATGAGAPGAYTSVSLAFDAQSKAPLVLSYPDAGSVQLYASYALPSPPAGTAITGSSNAFVVRPFGLRVSGVTAAASPSPSSPVFAKAGANFSVTLTAVAWKAGDDANADGVPDSDAQIASNAVTPNFGQESTPATATLAQTLNAPAGGNAGTLGGSTSFGGFSAGAKTQSVNWSEVGFVDLHAASANYLGSGQSVTNSSAGLTGVGRFTPDHFALSGGALANRTDLACSPASSFTYMGEAIGLHFTLTAQNAAGATTQNYNTATGYAKLPTVPAGMGFGAVNGTTDLTSRLDLGNSGVLTWSAGAASVDYTLAVNRASPDNPDGPFAAAKIGVAPSDSDGVTLASSAYDMDVDNNAVNEHQQVGASTQLLFGRLLLRNALGPATSVLPVPISVQSWQGSAFGTNALDSCTKIPQSAIVLGGYAGALAPAPNCNTYVQQNPVSFSAGVGTLTLAAPAGAVTGSVLLTPNLYSSAAGNYCTGTGSAPAAASAASTPYLLGRWNDLLDPDANASTMYDDDPSARAAFGLYGSQPDNLIFQRENY
jgi:MSHA biogenesis protein MshQ